MVQVNGHAWDVWLRLERQGCVVETEKHLHSKWDQVVFVATICHRGVALATGSGRTERQAFLAALIEAVQVQDTLRSPVVPTAVTGDRVASLA
ncbi:hypothetical protein ACMT4L_06900 [Deinococcus sp. A31D244]|uniref:hypothetical protein n=1 Tax=Deinococcus sp. A31D244 TaxID=3397675 RepID=UPI0039DFCBA1